MKAFVSKLGQILLLVLLTPFLLLGAILALLYIPVDHIRYKRSHYYKDFGLRYHVFVGISPYYRLYEVIKKNDLPIRYIKTTGDGEHIAHGYFLYGDTLIFNDFSNVYYNDDENLWVYEFEDRWISVDEMIETSIDDLRDRGGYDGIMKGVILIKRNSFADDDLPRAEKSGRFILYDKKCEAEALKHYISAAKKTEID